MKILFFLLLSLSLFSNSKETLSSILLTKTTDTNSEGTLYKINFKNTISEDIIVFDTKTSFIKKINFYNHKKELLSKKLISLKKHVYQIKNTKKNTYYVRVDLYKKKHLPIIISTPYKYYNKHNTHNILDGIYIGFVLMVFLLNLFFYSNIRDNVFIYYIAFLVSINIGILSIDGYLLTLIKQPLLYNVILFLKYLVPVTGALFATKFLNLKTRTPYIIAITFSSITFLLYLIRAISGNFIYEAIADLVAFLHLIVFWTFGIQQYKQNPYAKFFVIGYSIILFSSMFYIIPDDFNFEKLKLSFSHIKLGAIFEMVILTYAISYRVKILREELNKAQEQLTNYLNQLKTQESDNKVIADKLTEKHKLSEREAEVLYLLLKQHTYKQISNSLFISTHTVKYHVSNLYKKLNIKNRKEISKIHLAS